MDEGTKTVEMIRNIMIDLNLPDVTYPTPLYNDNRGSVDWSRGASLSKRLRHMNIREVGVRDSIRLKSTTVHHIPGAHNVADIFTKEHKSSTLFASLAAQLIFPRFNSLRSDEPELTSEDPVPGGSTDRIASFANRGRIKGGVISNVDSPAHAALRNTWSRHIRASM
jgi:hypothetical protein